MSKYTDKAYNYDSGYSVILDYVCDQLHNTLTLFLSALTIFFTSAFGLLLFGALIMCTEYVED